MWPMRNAVGSVRPEARGGENPARLETVANLPAEGRHGAARCRQRRRTPCEAPDTAARVRATARAARTSAAIASCRARHASSPSS